MTTEPGADRDGAMKNLRHAHRRVRSVLVANADRLSAPFTDDPDKNPWDTFVRPAMRDLDDAVKAIATVPVPPPATQPAVERVGRHLAAKDHPHTDWAALTDVCREVYLADAREVLAVLPEPTNRSNP